MNIFLDCLEIYSPVDDTYSQMVFICITSPLSIDTYFYVFMYNSIFSLLFIT
jgi:hypothetical protein